MAAASDVVCAELALVSGRVVTMKTLRIVLVVAMAFLLSGCAMITGTVTGAFTGAIDAPAETYRHNREAFAEHPILFAPDALIMGPVGIVIGPIFGLSKGVALDVQWTIGQVDYADVFGSYGKVSIWRPYTLSWPSRAGMADE